MPKNQHLFGVHFRKGSRDFSRTQISRPLPVKARGRQLSAGSQMHLWHSDDFNFTSKTWGNMVKTKHLIKPFQYKKDVESTNLNCTLANMRLTPSSLYAMDDSGGFDEYILRTTPEEMRSCYGEKIRNLMYWYMENPEAKSWGLPATVLLRKKEQNDPYFARFKFLAAQEDKKKRVHKQHAPYSPYYLPTEALMHPARQQFLPGSEESGKLNLWWNQSKVKDMDNPCLTNSKSIGMSEVEKRFRWRLQEAKGFERRFADHRMPDGYRKGQGMGRGGPSNTHVQLRCKTHRFRDLRPY